jgi:hypothetical protein
MQRKQGCQIYLGTKYQNGENIPNCHKIYQVAIKYFPWPLNKQNGHKIYQDFTLKNPPKFTKIGSFWFENNPSGNPERNNDIILYPADFIML